MQTKRTPISQKEIRFLLKDFPCDGIPQEEADEAPYAAPFIPQERLLEHESLAKQLRRLFAAAQHDKKR